MRYIKDSFGWWMEFLDNFGMYNNTCSMSWLRNLPKQEDSARTEPVIFIDPVLEKMLQKEVQTPKVNTCISIV
ncbi:hypothetical protein ACF0H5_020726 [Mactra antiquata]